jgi:hypothetical protein
LLTSQAAFNLSHEVFGEAQVVESLLQDLSGMLRLGVVAMEAFRGGAAPALYRFGLSFMILSDTAHGVLLPLLG